MSWGGGGLVFGIIRAPLVFVGSGEVNAGQLVCNSTLELAFWRMFMLYWFPHFTILSLLYYARERNYITLIPTAPFKMIHDSFYFVVSQYCTSSLAFFTVYFHPFVIIAKCIAAD